MRFANRLLRRESAELSADAAWYSDQLIWLRVLAFLDPCDLPELMQ